MRIQQKMQIIDRRKVLIIFLVIFAVGCSGCIYWCKRKQKIFDEEIREGVRINNIAENDEAHPIVAPSEQVD